MLKSNSSYSQNCQNTKSLSTQSRKMQKMGIRGEEVDQWLRIELLPDNAGFVQIVNSVDK